MTRLPTDWGEGGGAGSHDTTVYRLGGGAYVPVHMTRLPTDWGEGVWAGSHDTTTYRLGGGDMGRFT